MLRATATVQWNENSIRAASHIYTISMQSAVIPAAYRVDTTQVRCVSKTIKLCYRKDDRAMRRQK